MSVEPSAIALHRRTNRPGSRTVCDGASLGARARRRVCGGLQEKKKKRKKKKKSTKKKVDAMNQANPKKRKKDCGSGARKKRR